MIVAIVDTCRGAYLEGLALGAGAVLWIRYAIGVQRALNRETRAAARRRDEEAPVS